MTDQVTELAPADIDRSGGVQPQQPAQHEQAPAEMGAEQQQALAEVEKLRGQYKKTPTDNLAKQISELQRFAFGNGDKPAGFMPGEIPLPDLSEYDPMSASMADLTKPINLQDREQLVVHAKIMGLGADRATLMAEFAVRAGLNNQAAKTIVDRLAKHQSHGYGLTDAPLAAEEAAELRAAAVQRYGTEDKFLHEFGLANAYINSIGMTEWMQKHGGSLNFDPHVISVFAFKARCAGLAPLP